MMLTTKETTLYMYSLSVSYVPFITYSYRMIPHCQIAKYFWGFLKASDCNHLT